MTDIPRDHQASLLPWLLQAAVGIAVVPTTTEDGIVTGAAVEVNNGLGGHAGAGSIIARCGSHTEAELLAVALWALVDRHWPRDDTGETIRVSGIPHPVKDIDDAAHATLHDPHATERERGMAAAIMALVDDRTREPHGA